MRAVDYIPGVPAAGHVTGRGFWHPGRADGCVKCDPDTVRVEVTTGRWREFDRVQRSGIVNKRWAVEHILPTIQAHLLPARVVEERSGGRVLAVRRPEQPEHDQQPARRSAEKEQPHGTE